MRRSLQESDMSVASTRFLATKIAMHVEKLKYTIWAADTERATHFYQTCFGGTVVRQNPHITEIEIAGSLIAIHGGGEGKSPTGMPPKTPWGKPAMGYRTRRAKTTGRLIVRSRHRK